MSRQITQPVNQVRLTNVAVVRMNRHGKRFEIACYRNKIVNYRQGTETDLSEVLQTDRVFTNVSKGQFANKSDLQKAFSTKDEESICKLILLKGQVQISDLEREAQYENTTREIATMISSKCVNPSSCRPYTTLQIRNAMKDAEFVVHPTKNVKQQFLDCVKLLKKKGVIEIERAKMELGVFLTFVKDLNDNDDEEDENIEDSVPDDNDDEKGGVNLLHEKRKECIEQLQSVGVTHFVPPSTAERQHQSQEEETKIIFQIDPSLYRAVDSTIKDFINVNNKETKNLMIRLEIIKQVVTMEGDAHMDIEIERKKEQQVVVTQQKEAQKEEDADAAVDGITRKTENIALVSDEENIDDNIDKSKTSTSSDENNEEDSDGVEQMISSTKQSKKQQKKKKKKNQAALAAAAAAAAASEPPISARKSNRKAMKKSKKAKRREKEEALERTERLEAEKKRLEERRKHHHHPHEDDEDESDDKESKTTTATTTTTSTTGETKACNTCGGSFDSLAQYRKHFKSDWHRYNVKLKMKGLAIVSEEEFLLCDSDAFFDTF